MYDSTIASIMANGSISVDDSVYGYDSPRNLCEECYTRETEVHHPFNHPHDPEYFENAERHFRKGVL